MLDIDKLVTDPDVTFEDVLSTLTASYKVPAYSEQQIDAIKWHFDYFHSALRLLKPRLANEATRESALKRVESYVKNDYFLTSDKAGMTDKQLLLANKFIKSIMIQEVSDLEMDYILLDAYYPVLTEVVPDPANKIMIHSVEIQPETTQSDDDYPVLTEVVTDETNEILIEPIDIQKEVETLSGDELLTFRDDVLMPMYHQALAELTERKRQATETSPLSDIEKNGLIAHACFIGGQIKIANQKIESGAIAKAEAQAQDVNVIPDAVTSVHQQIENKPKKSRLTTWLLDSWASSANVVKRVATAAATALLGFGVGGAVSLATAFTISTQAPPEVPEALKATPIAVTAATDAVVDQASVAPPVTVADTAPAAKMVKPTLSAKTSFAHVADNYKFSPATINGVQLQKTSFDTIERMCKSDIPETWVCQKTPENI